jgi:hypothetical protein
MVVAQPAEAQRKRHALVGQYGVAGGRRQQRQGFERPDDGWIGDVVVAVAAVAFDRQKRTIDQTPEVRAGCLRRNSGSAGELAGRQRTTIGERGEHRGASGFGEQLSRRRDARIGKHTSILIEVCVRHHGWHLKKEETVSNKTLSADCARIFEEWQRYALAGDVEALLELYATDAELESPLVTEILGREAGVCRGQAELRRFFDEGSRRRPNALVRWYRTGVFFCAAGMLVWEYPREAPDGDQVDIAEFMELADGKIRRHRIYWGWFGVRMLRQSREAKAGASQVDR